MSTDAALRTNSPTTDAAATVDSPKEQCPQARVTREDLGATLAAVRKMRETELAEENRPRNASAATKEGQGQYPAEPPANQNEPVLALPRETTAADSDDLPPNRSWILLITVGLLALLVSFIVHQHYHDTKPTPEPTVGHNTPLVAPRFSPSPPELLDIRPTPPRPQPALVKLYSYSVREKKPANARYADIIAERFMCPNGDMLLAYNNKVNRDFSSGETVWVPGDDCAYQPPQTTTNQPLHNGILLTHTVQSWENGVTLEEIVRQYSCTQAARQFAQHRLPRTVKENSLPTGTVIYLPGSACRSSQ